MFIITDTMLALKVSGFVEKNMERVKDAQNKINKKVKSGFNRGNQRCLSKGCALNYMGTRIDIPIL